MASRRVPGRCLVVSCPRCHELVRLNWCRSRKQQQTIHVIGTPAVEVFFSCNYCTYRVSLGVKAFDPKHPVPNL